MKTQYVGFYVNGKKSKEILKYPKCFKTFKYPDSNLWYIDDIYAYPYYENHLNTFFINLEELYSFTYKKSDKIASFLSINLAVLEDLFEWYYRKNYFYTFYFKSEFDMTIFRLKYNL